MTMTLMIAMTNLQKTMKRFTVNDITDIFYQYYHKLHDLKAFLLMQVE